MSVDTVLFDLDDTLCEYEQDSREVLAESFDRCGVEPFFELSDYHARYDEFLTDGETIAELRANCFAAIAEESGHGAETGRAVADAFADVRDHSRVRFCPGASETLEALARDHAVGVVTNGGPEMQRTKMAALGIDDRVEAVVFAGHDAPAKPEPEPFERALAELGSTPDRAVHVGNSLDSDVAGAHAAGLRSVWVPADPSVVPEPEPHFAFETLRPLGDRPWLGD
ncbi:HAD family hydrolase [halophilic archaeon]|nr:HAD family hydrolase [halophilic archaeon]